MSEHLLLADIGNTCIKIVFARPDALEATYSLPTRTQHTADSLGLSLMQLLALRELRTSDITACLVCSVVPDVSTLLHEALHKYLNITPLTFPGDFSIDLVNGYDQPQEVGADRLLAAYAARTLFPDTPSVISVDFGTATTFDCVSGNTYLGGCIIPGVRVSAEALSSRASQLPGIQLDKPRRVIGKNTVECMRSGIMYGAAAMLDGMLDRIEEELGKPVTVVATGGMAQFIAPLCKREMKLERDLLLKGLNILYKKNHKS